MCTIVKRVRDKTRKTEKIISIEIMTFIISEDFSYSYNFKIARDFSVFIKNICIFKAFHLLTKSYISSKEILSNATLLHEIDKDKL